MEALKPCPFCGTVHVQLLTKYAFDGYQGESPEYIAICPACGASISTLHKERTIALWNKRKDD